MSDLKAEVLAMEDARHRALTAGDIDGLDRIFADNLIVTHTRGLTQNKRELLDYIRNELEFLAVERGPITLSIFGDVAVMSGVVVNRVRGRLRRDMQEVRSQTLQVWCRHDGAWRLVALQATALPDYN